MKKRFTWLAMLTFIGGVSAQVGIGTTTPEGILDTSNVENFAVVLPQGIERDVTNPQGGNVKEGSVYFDTNKNCLRVFSGAQWIDINCQERLSCLQSVKQDLDLETQLEDKSFLLVDPKFNTAYSDAKAIGNVQFFDATVSQDKFFVDQVLYQFDSGAELVVIDPDVNWKIDLESAPDGGVGTTVEGGNFLQYDDGQEINGFFVVQVGIRGSLSADSKITSTFPPMLDFCPIVDEEVIINQFSNP